MICTLFTGQTSKEGIFMRFSYEYKKRAVELYRQGIWIDTPEGIKTKNFRIMIRRWALIEETRGPDALKHKNYKDWTPEERYVLVARVLSGESTKSVAFSSGVTDSQLYQWVRKYKIYGYNGLITNKKGRKSKNPDMKKIGTRKPPKPNESEYEELIRLRAENEYMKAEIEVIKKEIALREEKEAARLKAKKRRSSKNSEKKGTN